MSESPNFGCKDPKELGDRIRSGHEGIELLEQVFQFLARELLRTALGFFRSHYPDAEDAVSETHVRIHSNRKQCTDAPIVWARTIHLHVCIDTLRRDGARHRNIPTADAIDITSDKNAKSPDSRLIQLEEHRYLSELVNRLPEEERIIIILKYWEGLNQAE